MEKKRSWFIRRWYVLVLGIVVGIVVLVGAIVAVVMASIKSSDAYKEALVRARGSTALIEAIGTPMNDGFMPTGSIEVSGDFGEAKLSISISGPKGSAVLHLDAEKSMGKWDFKLLKAVIDDTGREIDLLEKKETGIGDRGARIRELILQEPPGRDIVGLRESAVIAQLGPPTSREGNALYYGVYEGNYKVGEFVVIVANGTVTDAYFEKPPDIPRPPEP